MTTRPEDIYDWLLSLGTPDPAVLLMGDRHVVGRWVTLAETTDEGIILKTETRGIEVLGWGASWEEARERTKAKIASTEAGRPSLTGPASPAAPETASSPAYRCAEATPRIPS